MPSVNELITQTEKLTDTNYPIWKIQVKILLLLDGGWSIVNGELSFDNFCGGTSGATDTTALAQDRAEWKTRCDSALALIILCISPSLYYKYGHATCPTALWAQIFADYKSRLRLMSYHLRYRLHNASLTSEESVTAYISRIRTCVEELDIAEKAATKGEVRFAMMKGLPESWDDFKEFVDGYPGADFEWVADQMLAWERALRVKTGDPANGDGKRQGSRVILGRSTSTDTGGACKNCGRMGHDIKKCWSPGGGNEGGRVRNRGRYRKKDRGINQQLDSVMFYSF